MIDSALRDFKPVNKSRYNKHPRRRNNELVAAMYAMYSTPEAPAVIMEKIAKCESGGTHYKKDGPLIKNINKNGTIDVGQFQINSAWEAKARSLNMDIYLPEGNEDFAYWLYETRGTEDWYSSKHLLEQITWSESSNHEPKNTPTA